MNLEEKIKEKVEEINSLGFKDKINLNGKEAAKVLSVSPSSVDNYRKQGIGIDYIELSGRILYPKRALAEFLVRSLIRTA
ncbi:helix-turn-helix domain-containing protein [Aliarcobacter butzleri]|uniref:helix-turn-helix domain-containing protein n=1 Tax=Aliarcobacter butzleri TaxID=28197 RepID=UPI001EDFB562|nr:helix-turn-helix domain-containing protein [Aliarcobacter butzleri]MCG3696808.1 helix-turn-helix domain-containing protein [Aliarcobacter butzleri]MCT7547289.1 helix-turn-helix domain-containing protein [Aliarcobacter butzleri]MCT7587992.1 helix-turn-helix domain-containing protein [Aliarcobacter butzleri]MDN5047787.1 helix-turn-helix domain-containing protein [Aliarcobacter butzleri]